MFASNIYLKFYCARHEFDFNATYPDPTRFLSPSFRLHMSSVDFFKSKTLVGFSISRAISPVYFSPAPTYLNFGAATFVLPIFPFFALRAGFGFIYRWYLYHHYWQFRLPCTKSLRYARDPINFLPQNFGGSDVHLFSRTQPFVACATEPGASL